jgi:hypothetical protein
MPVIPDTRNAEIWRIAVHGQLRQKLNETPSPNHKSGMVLHACNPSYTGGIGRRIVVRGQPWTKM